ncbi:unnamed protein product [Periconia digitata]|uniref:Uncharacterized protein n=1 Tax=Periconia digitata TaxID=1303443 RepID=A0A9W4UBI7_9PLEO|nr:unnamed protein product [Periconia digitata]
MTQTVSAPESLPQDSLPDWFEGDPSLPQSVSVAGCGKLAESGYTRALLRRGSGLL